jgi:inorganic pyrophosphatase
MVMEDEKGMDEKVLAVSTKDPHFAEVHTLRDVPEHGKMPYNIHALWLTRNLTTTHSVMPYSVEGDCTFLRHLQGT